MLGHLDLWHQFRGPLVAFAVAVGLAAAGRFLRINLLGAAAGGAGVLAGWYAIAGWHMAVATPASIDVLSVLAVVSLLIGLLCTWLGRNRLAWAGAVLAALATGWLLSGVPRHEAALRESAPVALVVGLAVLVFARAVADSASDPKPLVLAGLTLAAALHVAAAQPIWVQTALVPGVVAVAMFALPPMPGTVTLPVAVDIAAVGSLVALAVGRLPKLGFTAGDAAALSPLLAVWLQPRATDRLRFAGRAAPLAGCVLAGGIAVGCVWVVRQILHH